MNLFARFFLVLLGFALAPLLGVGVWVLGSNEAAKENARRLHEQLAGLTAEGLESAASEMNRALSFVGELERTGGKDPGFEMKVLHRAVATRPEFALIAVIDAAGTETVRLADERLYPPGEGAPLGESPLVAQARDSGRALVAPIVTQKGRPVAPVVHPLDSGRVLFVGYSLSRAFDKINRLRVGASGRLLLIGADGRPLPGAAEGFPEENWKGPGPLEGDTGWFETIETAAGPMTGAFVSVPTWKLKVLSLQPRAEAFAKPERFALKAVAVLAMAAGLAALVALGITGRITGPLQHLIAGAQRASRGEFGERVPEEGWGEIQELSRTFNKMTGTLQSYQEMQVERLMEEKFKVEALMHNIPDGIILCAMDGSVLYINTFAQGLLSKDGRTAPDSKRVLEFLPDKALREMVLSIMQRKKRAMTVDVELKNPAGERRGLFACSTATVGASKREIGFLLLMRDVTAERDLDAMKEEFLHSIVHDLRSPLSSIDGFVSLMARNDTLGEQEKTYLSFMVKSSKRLKDLVSDILDMAKLESGTMELKRVEAAAQDFLDAMKTIYLVQTQAKKISLVLNGPAAPPDKLVCDKGLIERVVMNLVGNALKFTPEGGTITVSVSPVGTEMEFVVSDTGPGIPQDKLSTVFEKFKQLEGGIKQGGGYGLGLSICKKVVGLHGGRIWAESEPGKGSAFKFRLPLN